MSYNLHKGSFSLSAIFSILSFTAIITPWNIITLNEWKESKLSINDSEYVKIIYMICVMRNEYESYLHEMNTTWSAVLSQPS